MQEYVGKICPYCKMEIKENEEVSVCPSCTVPYHKVCWDKNGGCANPECNQTSNDEKQIDSMKVCPNCGAPLADDQEFCPKCGTHLKSPKQNLCGKCGAELQEGQEFCHKCGQKINFTADTNTALAITQISTDADKPVKKKGKTKIIIVSAVSVIVIALIAVAIVMLPKMLISVDELCAQGKYAEAYERADEDKKLEVKAESIAAVQSAVSADYLKDPSSFNLRDVYYREGIDDDDGSQYANLVLYISGTNGFGGITSSYWLYTWDSDDGWEYYASVSDLDSEEYSKYDDIDEATEKLIDNLARISIKNTISDGIELSKDGVKRINNMFENDTLDSVEALDVN